MSDPKTFESQALRGAVFKDCALTGARFDDVDLSGAIFDDTELEDAKSMIVETFCRGLERDVTPTASGAASISD